MEWAGVAVAAVDGQGGGGVTCTEGAGGVHGGGGSGGGGGGGAVGGVMARNRSAFSIRAREQIF